MTNIYLVSKNVTSNWSAKFHQEQNTKNHSKLKHNSFISYYLLIGNYTVNLLFF